MNYISDVLFWITTGMLVPVIILLIFFFLRALLLLGGFFGQYLVKRKLGAEIREQMNTLTLDNIDTLGDLAKEQAGCHRFLYEETRGQPSEQGAGEPHPRPVCPVC